jgi:hypothetical protein
MENKQNDSIDLEALGISTIAAASKTPFRTALKITLGIAIGRSLIPLGLIAAIIIFFLYR